MRWAAALACLAVLSMSAAAKAPMAWPSGTWGNVHTHAETGDMLGMEARFYEDDGQHWVEFVWCEGWCNEVRVLPVTRTDEGLAFAYAQKADVGGPLDYRFVARPGGGRMKVIVREGTDTVDQETLRPLRRPFAIPFARANGAR